MHGWDARLKLVCLVVLLVGVSLERSLAGLIPHATLVSALVIFSRLPLGAFLARWLMILPLPLMLAGATWMAGDPGRAQMVLAKSAISSLAALTVACTTPLPRLLAALEALGLPRALVMTIQLVWRYTFVVAECGVRMSQAARCRSGAAPARRLVAQAGAGLMTALFARSHARAEGVQRAMAARGYAGSFPLLDESAWGLSDWMAAVLSMGVVALAVWL